MIGLGSDKYEIVIELGDDNDHCGYMDDDGHDRDDSHCGLILNTKDITCRTTCSAVASLLVDVCIPHGIPTITVMNFWEDHWDFWNIYQCFSGVKYVTLKYGWSKNLIPNLFPNYFVIYQSSANRGTRCFFRKGVLEFSIVRAVEDVKSCFLLAVDCSINKVFSSLLDFVRWNNFKVFASKIEIWWCGFVVQFCFGTKSFHLT